MEYVFSLSALCITFQTPSLFRKEKKNTDKVGNLYFLTGGTGRVIQVLLTKHKNILLS